MKWLKAIIAGLLAGLVMFIILAIGTNTGIAPFNIPPSAAFLASRGISPETLAPILHFAYAALGSVILVVIFDRVTNITRGIGWAIILWLIFMIIYSPLIGWGVFGVGGANQELPPDAPLYIGDPGQFILITLLLHVVYGAIIGWLDRVWIDWSDESRISEGSPNL